MVSKNIFYILKPSYEPLISYLFFRGATVKELSRHHYFLAHGKEPDHPKYRDQTVVKVIRFLQESSPPTLTMEKGTEFRMFLGKRLTEYPVSRYKITFSGLIFGYLLHKVKKLPEAEREDKMRRLKSIDFSAFDGLETYQPIKQLYKNNLRAFCRDVFFYIAWYVKRVDSTLKENKSRGFVLNENEKITNKEEVIKEIIKLNKNKFTEMKEVERYAIFISKLLEVRFSGIYPIISDLFSKEEEKELEEIEYSLKENFFYNSIAK